MTVSNQLYCSYGVIRTRFVTSFHGYDVRSNFERGENAFGVKVIYFLVFFLIVARGVSAV